jgi:hypothetical protein
MQTGKTMKSLITPTRVYMKNNLLWIPVEIRGEDMKGLAYSMMESYKKGELEPYSDAWFKVGFMTNESSYGVLEMIPKFGNIQLFQNYANGPQEFGQNGLDSFLKIMKGYIEGKHGPGVEMDVSGIYMRNNRCLFQAHVNKEKHPTAVISQKTVTEPDILPFADAEVAEGRIKLYTGKGPVELALPCD